MPVIKGTSSIVDRRADAKALKKTKFPAHFSKAVDVRKVNRPVMATWIDQRVTKALGFEDEIVSSTVLNLFLPELGGDDATTGGIVDESRNAVDPKEAQIALSGFLGEETGAVTSELWKLMLEAQESPGGVPKSFVEEKKRELELQKAKEEEQREEMMKQQRLVMEEQQRRNRDRQQPPPPRAPPPQLAQHRGQYPNRIPEDRRRPDSPPRLDPYQRPGARNGFQSTAYSRQGASAPPPRSGDAPGAAAGEVVDEFGRQRPAALAARPDRSNRDGGGRGGSSERDPHRRNGKDHRDHPRGSSGRHDSMRDRPGHDSHRSHRDHHRDPYDRHHRHPRYHDDRDESYGPHGALGRNEKRRDSDVPPVINESRRDETVKRPSNGSRRSRSHSRSSASSRSSRSSYSSSGSSSSSSSSSYSRRRRQRRRQRGRSRSPSTSASSRSRSSSSSASSRSSNSNSNSNSRSSESRGGRSADSRDRSVSPKPALSNSRVGDSLKPRDRRRRRDDRSSSSGSGSSSSRSGRRETKVSKRRTS